MLKKNMVTFCVILYAVVVPFLEINNTHVFNPDWTPHARIHEVWQLITNTAIGIFCLWLVWFRNHIILSAVLSLFVISGFLIAYLIRHLYNGSMIQSNGIELIKLLGINIGVLGFGLASVLLLISIYLEYNKNKNYE